LIPIMSARVISKVEWMCVERNAELMRNRTRVTGTDRTSTWGLLAFRQPRRIRESQKSNLPSKQECLRSIAPIQRNVCATE